LVFSQPKYSTREPGEPLPATADAPPGELLTLAEADDEPLPERTVTPRLSQFVVSSVRGPRAT
jgi:hypothetical protein